MAISKQIDSLIQKWAADRQIPYTMLYKQVLAESNGNPNAVGDNGKSRGLMQIHENTAMGELGVSVMELPKLFDPDFNLEKGTLYLTRIRDRYLVGLLPQDTNQKWSMIVMAYNSGPGYMKKALERLRDAGKPITIQNAVLEMQKPDFGKHPIFSVTIAYAKKITGVDAATTILDKVGSRVVAAGTDPASMLSVGIGAALILTMASGMLRRG